MQTYQSESFSEPGARHLLTQPSPVYHHHHHFGKSELTTSHHQHYHSPDQTLNPVLVTTTTAGELPTPPSEPIYETFGTSLTSGQFGTAFYESSPSSGTFDTSASAINGDLPAHSPPTSIGDRSSTGTHQQQSSTTSPNRNIMVQLLDLEIWKRFCEVNNEMIVTKGGRYSLAS